MKNFVRNHFYVNDQIAEPDYAQRNRMRLLGRKIIEHDVNSKHLLHKTMNENTPSRTDKKRLRNKFVVNEKINGYLICFTNIPLCGFRNIPVEGNRYTEFTLVTRPRPSVELVLPDLLLLK